MKYGIIIAICSFMNANKQEDETMKNKYKLVCMSFDGEYKTEPY